MSITVYTYNDKVLKNAANDKWLKKYVDPQNPLGLPLNTIRVRCSSDIGYIANATATAVQGQNYVYDVTANSSQWGGIFQSKDNLVEIIGANTNGVTSLQYTFADCHNVETGALALTQQLDNLSPKPSSWESFYRCGTNTVTGAAEYAQIDSYWK